MFYRHRILVIDGKYNNDDGLSTRRMCQVGTKSVLGRRSRASSIRSEEIVQRMRVFPLMEKIMTNDSEIMAWQWQVQQVIVGSHSEA
jgi:hypothetical protein